MTSEVTDVGTDQLMYRVLNVVIVAGFKARTQYMKFPTTCWIHMTDLAEKMTRLSLGVAYYKDTLYVDVPQ